MWILFLAVFLVIAGNGAAILYVLTPFFR